MPLPPGIPDPGADFRCARCSRFTFSSLVKCECPDGPLDPRTVALPGGPVTMTLTHEQWKVAGLALLFAYATAHEDPRAHGYLRLLLDQPGLADRVDELRLLFNAVGHVKKRGYEVPQHG